MSIHDCVFLLRYSVAILACWSGSSRNELMLLMLLRCRQLQVSSRP